MLQHSFSLTEYKTIKKEMKMYTYKIIRNIVIIIISLIMLSCSSVTTVRKAGQEEFFSIKPYKNTKNIKWQLIRPSNNYSTYERINIEADWGDHIRYNTDIITIQVHNVFINELPPTLTNSHDVVLFCEIWENAAAGNINKPLTSIVYTAQNVLIPGMLNFTGNLAYGPTHFKGHPLKIKFTLLILQKRIGAQQANTADLLNNFVKNIPGYGSVASTAINTIRDILKAQPDVIAFDFESTLLSDQPKKLMQASNENNGQGRDDGDTTKLDKSKLSNKNLLYSNFGWLKYGYYAIVETKSPTSILQAKKNKTNDNRFNSQINYCLDGGYLKSNNGDLLHDEYIVFSITPHQLPENEGLLREASDQYESELKVLRQTQANVAAAIDSVNETADTINITILQKHLESLALDTLKSDIGSNSFVSFKQKLCPRIKSAYDAAKVWIEDVSQPTRKQQFRIIVEDILADYQTMFENFNKVIINNDEKTKENNKELTCDFITEILTTKSDSDVTKASTNNIKSAS